MCSYQFDNAAVCETTDRFASLEARYDPVSIRRLRETGIGPSWRCLEVGAGAGSVARWLGEQVGDTGSVLATDIDPRLTLANGSQVEVVRHDIVRDPLPTEAFDLVHARLVLLHLPERRRVLDRLRQALKPGGVLLLEDFDCTWLPVLATPTADSGRLFTKVVDGIHHLLQQAGADLAWGRNCYQSLVDAGFVDVTVRGFSEAWRGGSGGAHLHRANARQKADQLTAQGLVSRGELGAFLDLVEDPRLTVSSYFMLSTAARRPSSVPIPRRARELA